MSIELLLSGGKQANNGTREQKYESALVEVKSIKGVLFGFPNRIESDNPYLYMKEGILMNRSIETFIEYDSNPEDLVGRTYDDPTKKIFRNQIFFSENDIVKVYSYTIDQVRKITEDKEIHTFLDELEAKYGQIPNLK